MKNLIFLILISCWIGSCSSIKKEHSFDSNVIQKNSSSMSQIHSKENELCLENTMTFDIGSGSLKTLTSEVDRCLQKIVKIYWQENYPLKVKESLKNNKNIIPNRILIQATNQIKNWKLKNANLKINSYRAVATEVFRKSSNGSKFIKQLSKQTGIPIKIINQSEEAKLGFLSALSVLQGSAEDILVWDIGGGSQQMTIYTKADGFKIYEGKLASVNFKDLVLKLQKSKNKKTPNPLGLHVASESTEHALFYAEKDVPMDFKNLTKNKKIIGIGGVHGKSVSKQVSNSDSYTILDLTQSLTNRCLLNDTDLQSEYPETEVTNLALVLGFMRYFDFKKVEVIDVDLTLGLALKGI